ncbi:DUF177 domain-containing protein [Aurantimonas sp. Leaf443]|uniref:YceD family protein n=1 Tax=Aurantimonas sp. Leaf443 TaxID=1736378 RepID=UPI0007021DF4|nr:DUF177 domain-containing protein [Aurantimonas sp. Leaf443]KQT88443.1 hypothetical protein ASG48_03245 [Aurantimonas sp. Leaf443]
MKNRKNPLSLWASVVKLPKAGMPIDFEAGPQEREGLADQLGILAVERLRAGLLVKAWRADGISVRGSLSAVVVQESVVTLEPVTQSVDEPVDLVFVPQNSRLARPPEMEGGELFIDPEGDDSPEPFAGDRIDLGPYLAEILSLGLDPYPRRSGEAFEAVVEDDPDADPARSAFDILRSIGPANDEGRS